MKMSMMWACTAALALAVVSATGGGAASSVTPLQKVLDLLAKMLEKADAAKKEEAAQWSAYQQFCSDTDSSKQEEIKTADLELEMLQATAEKKEAVVGKLEEEIKGHEADIEGFNEDLKTSTEQRQDAHKDYEKLHLDLRESVDALGKAIAVLSKQQGKISQSAAGLLQQAAAARAMPKKARAAIQAYLQRGAEEPELEFEAPPEGQPHAYESQSGGVLDLLKELLGKFTEEKRQLEKKELTERQAQEMLAHDLSNSRAAAEHEIEKKQKRKGKAEQARIDAEQQHKKLSDLRADTMKYLEDLRTTCQGKADDFEKRQKLREQEIEALSKAHAVLTSDKVSAAAEKHLPSLIQRSRKPASSLVQKYSAPQGEGQMKAAEFLKGESTRLGSHVLSALAEHVQEDPFAKVKKMIQDMVTKLKEEAAEEAKHKEWCDTEMGTNLQTRESKTTEVETLHSTIEQLTAETSTLKKDIAALSKEIAALSKAVVEETKIRESEKARNEDTIAEAVAAQMQITEAMKVLKDFYSSAEEAEALLQRQEPPPSFDAPYQGQQTEKDNVIAYLEVIHSDFARLETETTAAERSAQDDHDKFLEDTDKEKGEKEKAVEDKGKDLKTKEEELQTAKRDLDMAQEELDAALAYYDKLRPSCVAGAAEGGPEQRIKRREEEITSLKEALSILSGESLPDFGSQALYSSVDGGNVGLEAGVTVGGA